MELGNEKNGWWYQKGSKLIGPLGKLKNKNFTLEHIYVEVLSDGELYNKISKCWIEPKYNELKLTRSKFCLPTETKLLIPLNSSKYLKPSNPRPKLLCGT